MTATTPSLREAAQMALDALELAQGELDPEVLDLTCPKVDAAIESIRAALALPEAEPVVALAFRTPTFKEVAPGLEVGYDMFGGVDIRLGGEFVYVHINYDYRYTHNAVSKDLADNIVKLLANGPQPAPVERKPLTKHEIHLALDTAGVSANGVKLEHEILVARAIETAHGIRCES